MGKFISNFNTTAELTSFSATTDFGRPHVSLTKDDNKVHYFDDPYKGHDYVEIGGLKWATMNVGANSITDYGLYFQWGDTQGYTAAQVTGSSTPHKSFNWADYKFNPSGDEETMTKYNSTDSKTTLDLFDDAARANWGGSWRMPTTEEFIAFGNATNSAWTADYQGSGVAGFVYTDKTDSSKALFFPAAGLCNSDMMYNVGIGGFYWSSSLKSSNTQAYYLNFSSSGTYWQSGYYRKYGFTVRGVVS